MTKTTRNDRSSEPSCRLLPSMPEAFDDLRMSVDRFCLLAGLESLNEMMSADAEALCGSRHARSGERKGHRWGTTRSEIAYHGGKVKIERPRVRDFAGREMSLTSYSKFWPVAANLTTRDQTESGFILTGAHPCASLATDPSYPATWPYLVD